MRKQLIYLISCIIICSFAACAQSKKAKSKGTGEAYARMFSYTINEHNSGYRAFYIMWKKRDSPISFYWRGEDGWTDCAVNKVKARYETTGDEHYSITKQVYDTEKENISLDSIKAGHYLKIITVPGGKNVIPSEIPTKAQNRLYFKTANTGWLYLDLNISR